MDVMMVLAICGFAVICGGVGMRIAAGKQRSPLLWALVGLVFNVVGLLVLVVMPQHRERVDLVTRAHGARTAAA